LLVVGGALNPIARRLVPVRFRCVLPGFGAEMVFHPSDLIDVFGIGQASIERGLSH
jgi:hypothetical protein